MVYKFQASSLDSVSFFPRVWSAVFSQSVTKVDFQVLCLQASGNLKISEVQVRVYYWQRLFNFTWVQVKFVLVDAVF